MRQAHRVARAPLARVADRGHRVRLDGSGIVIQPRWVLAGLLTVALVSSRIVIGTGASAAASSTQPGMARLSAAVTSLGSAVADHLSDLSGGIDGSELDSTSLVFGPMIATTPIVEASPSPASALATRRPTTLPTPTPRPAVVTAQKVTTRATVAPKPTPRPTPRPTPKPTPAIVYPYKATGNATSGNFGGAVITRLPAGTQIRVCGSLGCWAGVSSGYGPSPDGGHLVDLDASIFERICGPLASGVAAIVLSWR